MAVPTCQAPVHHSSLALAADLSHSWAKQTISAWQKSKKSVTMLNNIILTIFGCSGHSISKQLCMSIGVLQSPWVQESMQVDQPPAIKQAQKPSWQQPWLQGSLLCWSKRPLRLPPQHCFSRGKKIEDLRCPALLT